MKLPSEIPGLLGAVVRHGKGLLQVAETRAVGEELAALGCAPSTGDFINRVEALEKRVAESARGVPLRQGVLDDKRTPAVGVTNQIN